MNEQDPEDKTRSRFLDDLSRSNLHVTISDAQFIERLGDIEDFSLLERNRIDRMRSRYASELRGRNR